MSVLSYNQGSMRIQKTLEFGDWFKLDEENGTVVLLLLGGYKNAQDKDIKKARKLLEKYKA